jgi:hypothetical protein
LSGGRREQAEVAGQRDGLGAAVRAELEEQVVPAAVTSVRAWRAVSRVKTAEARAADEAKDGAELMVVIRERTALVRCCADEAYPRTSEKRQRYTAVSGYNDGYTHG